MSLTALADLARAGRIELLVTQNVDGLHERAGMPPDRLITIHGSDAAVVCLACGARAERAVAQQAWERGVAVPCCPCGGPWKPATISFGQPLVAADLERAFAAAAVTAILTASETPFAAATFRLHEPVERTLPALRDHLVPAA
ncbi:MAG TPA: Sir2 family NAD-dependent protein deacetylase [Candidatus Limnocylindria bacterium]|nr:Sir2 family NAD-dependent protein deacetylase [Candidatus Limnocylindria bacterium]